MGSNPIEATSVIRGEIIFYYEITGHLANLLKQIKKLTPQI
jgi:hypothetical protein